MAVTITAGAWAAGTSANAASLPASPQAGDLHVKFIGAKPYSATLVNLAGWTLITGTNGSNGVVANGTDVGSVVWAAWYRYWVAGDAASPSFTVTTGNTNLGVMIRFRPTAGSAIDTPVGAKGSDISSGTGYSVTFDANPGITANDALVHFSFIAGNNSTFGTPTITATGATIGTVTENPATEGATAGGLDCEASSSTALVSSGTASAAPVGGWTLSVAQTGGGAFVRIRESVAGPTLVTLAVVELSVVTLTNFLSYFRTLAVVELSVASLATALVFLKALSVSAGTIVSLATQTILSVILSVVEASVVTLSRLSSYLRTLSVVSLSVVTLFTKGVSLILKNAANALVANTLVKWGIFEYGGGTPSDASWMSVSNKGTDTTNASGELKVPYSGATAKGGTVYVSILHPDTTPTQSLTWTDTVK